MYSTKWSHPAAKPIIEIALTSVFNIIIFIAGFGYVPIWSAIISCSATIVIYIIVQVVYGNYSQYLANKYHIHEDKLDELREKNEDLRNVYESQNQVFLDIYNLLSNEAKNINLLTHSIVENKQLNANLWSFTQVCEIVCTKCYDVIEQMFARSLDLEISYIQVDRSGETVTGKMIAYYNKNHSLPTIYNYKITINPHKKKKDTYSFECIVNENIQELVFYPENEIREKFRFKNKLTKKECKYKQYIAIPIYCDSQKIIGVLQLASFEHDELFGSGKQKNEQLVELIHPFVAILLLADKVSKCIYTIAGIKNEEKKDGKEKN